MAVFEGCNAQGKTALLEAIYLGATGRSFRTPRDADLMRFQADSTRVKLRLERDSGKQRGLELEWTGREGNPQRVIRINDLPVRKLADFLRELPLALFTPDDLELVQGGPGARRGFLDLLLCKLSPAYLEALGRYGKVLRQKLALLKGPRPISRDLLESWQELQVQFGVEVSLQRQSVCQTLAPLLARIYARLSGESAPLELRYLPAGATDSVSFFKLLHAQAGEEARRRSALVGPQRDEVELLLPHQGGAVRRFGSQGQQRTLALALRLAQAELLRELGHERPVVLLDDCFSELDPGRQLRLLEWLGEASQVLITTATPLHLPCAHRLFRVQGGQVTAC